MGVLNSPTSQIELVAGEDLADFCPLIESCLPQPNVCGTVGNKATLQVTSDTIDSIINPLLHGKDRGKLKNLLLKFSDVFDEHVGHTTITHEINTGNSAPIKQNPRRIPFAHCEESERQITDMLERGIIREPTSPWSRFFTACSPAFRPGS